MEDKYLYNKINPLAINLKTEKKRDQELLDRLDLLLKVTPLFDNMIIVNKIIYCLACFARTEVLQKYYSIQEIQIE